MNPTLKTYDELQSAFDYFNSKLFATELPPCLITLQREKKTYGYFSPERFINSDGDTTDEIAMNPCYFAICPPEEIMQTLVHEMTHLWQHHFGRPGRRGYHNKEWARKMESIGLMPSSTGKPGGKKLGDKVADYIIPGAIFDNACKKLFTDDFKISWADRFPARKQLQAAIADGSLDMETIKENPDNWGIHIDDNGHLIMESEKKQTRHKFTCPECSSNAWGKPCLHLICGDCNARME